MTLEALTVNYKDFDPANLIFESPQSQTSKEKDPKTGQLIQYMTLPFKYRYRYTDSLGNQKTAIGDLIMEGPEVASEKGIVVDTKEDKEKGTSRTTSTIPVVFDLRNPDIADFASDSDVEVKDEKGQTKLDPEGRPLKQKQGAIYRFHNAVVKKMLEIQDRITVGGYAAVSSIDAMNGQFFQTLYWSKTGKHAEGQNPSKFFDLINQGKEGSVFHRQTLFTLPTTDEKDLINMFPDPKSVDPTTGKATKTRFPGGRIPWDYLKGVEMKFIPLIRFKPIFIGQKASEKFQIESAIVTSLISSGSVTKQKVTIDKLKTAKPNLLSTLQSQIERLSIQDQTLKNPSFTTVGESHSASTSSVSPATSAAQSALQSQIALLAASTNSSTETKAAASSAPAVSTKPAETQQSLLPAKPSLDSILSSSVALNSQSTSSTVPGVSRTLNLHLSS